MSADIVKLPPRRGAAAPKAGMPLVLVAKQAVRLLRLAECDMEKAPPKIRKAAMFMVQEAANDLEKAIAAHGAEQAYNIGEMFLLAMVPEENTRATLAGAKATLRLLAESLP